MSIYMNSIMQKFEFWEVCCWVGGGEDVLSWFGSSSSCGQMIDWDFPFVQFFGKPEKRKSYGE